MSESTPYQTALQRLSESLPRRSGKSDLTSEIQRALEDVGVLTFTLPGAPRTKKTSNRLVTLGRTGRQKILPSAAFVDWQTEAGFHLAKYKAARNSSFKTIIKTPVNCKALFYRDKDVGDAVGFYQALADCLEEYRIVFNDSLIVSWDGSRMLKDALNPRVEVTLEPVKP